MEDLYYKKYIKYKSKYLQNKNTQIGAGIKNTYMIYFNKNKIDKVLNYFQHSKAYNKLGCFNYQHIGDTSLSWSEISLIFGYDAWYIENNTNVLTNIGKPGTVQHDMLLFLRDELNKNPLPIHIGNCIKTLNMLGISGENLDTKIALLSSTYHLPENISSANIKYPLIILNDKNLNPNNINRNIDSVIIVEINSLLPHNKILFYKNFSNIEQSNIPNCISPDKLKYDSFEEKKAYIVWQLTT